MPRNRHDLQQSGGQPPWAQATLAPPVVLLRMSGSQPNRNSYEFQIEVETAADAVNLIQEPFIQMVEPRYGFIDW